MFERYSKRFKVGLRTLQAILEHLSYRCQREGVLRDAQNARLFFCQARKKKRGSFAREGEKLPEKIPVGRFLPGILFLGIKFREEIFLLKRKLVKYK